MSTGRHTLMEEAGFELIAQPDQYWVSWIAHNDCLGGPGHPQDANWRWVNVFGGRCNYCKESLPEGLVGAWKLHNYDHYAKALRIRANIKRLS